MKKRSSVVGGAILILVGLFFLGLQMFPSLFRLLDLGQQWPLIVIAVGVFFLFGAFAGTPPLAIPGSIVTGVGAILYYQNLTGHWESWAYIWALIPGFVGVGLLLSAMLGGQREGIMSGRRLIIISAILFLVFTGFLGGVGQFWPVALIIFGLWLVIKSRRVNQGVKGKDLV